MANAGGEIWPAVLRVDAWLETMRGPQGYGGPVAHWWQNCLLFTGAGLDWRYEGIILGYLALFDKTGEERWLVKARRAGDDLVASQLLGGNYRNSSFEQNPYPGGTPHEAANDLALVHLAQVLQERADAPWEGYAEAAERNLRSHFLGRLWDVEMGTFRDHITRPTFVPNKAATLSEAWLALARLRGDDEPAVRYALPTLDAVRKHQVRGGQLDGAIDQYSERGKPAGRYFPYYVARCVPALVGGYEWAGDEAYLDAAVRAMGFVTRSRNEDGSFPQVVYANGHTNRYPQWVAGTGDILRALELVRTYGVEGDPGPTRERLLGGQAPSGGFHTARGFASQVSQREPGAIPELRDVLPVAGWTDKAFRYLAGTLRAGETESEMEEAAPTYEAAAAYQASPTYQARCKFSGERMRFLEDGETMEVRREGGDVVYRWRKGQPWAEVAAPELWLK